MYRFNDFRVKISNVVQLAVENVSFEYNIFVLNSVRMLTNSLCLNLMKLKTESRVIIYMFLTWDVSNLGEGNKSTGACVQEWSSWHHKGYCQHHIWQCWQKTKSPWLWTVRWDHYHTPGMLKKNSNYTLYSYQSWRPSS